MRRVSLSDERPAQTACLVTKDEGLAQELFLKLACDADAVTMARSERAGDLIQFRLRSDLI
jgi:hypothetical protein